MGFAGRIAANGARLVRRMTMGRVPAEPSGNWLVVEVSGDLPEQTHVGFGPPVLGLLDVLRCIEAAGEDPRLDGVLVRVRGALHSFGQAAALRRALLALREAGRGAVVWADGMAAAPYLLASGADRIWMPESGSLFLVGLRTERVFLRELLERLGARPEVVHVGRFKSAGETFTRDSMSDEEREQIESWQSDLWDELVTGIAQSRSLPEHAVRELIDRGPYPAAAAREAGLIDGIVYWDQVERELWPLARTPGPASPGPRRVHLVPASAYYFANLADAGWEPLWRDRPQLVYLLAHGGVRRGEGQRGISVGGTGRLLAALREAPRVRGVALRIESGGGDALASDLIHRRVEQLSREKPVVVSMGDVVASGGYYIAAAADAVFAEPAAITGSIGVVGGKLNLEGLYERLGIAKDGVQKGARAGLLSEARGFSSDERSAVRREMEAVYRTFVARVAQGRDLPGAEVEKIAQGRIWSGRRALALGLVDALGGPLDALRDAASRAGLRPGERYALATLPRGPRFAEWLGQLAGLRAALARGQRARIL